MNNSSFITKVNLKHYNLSEIQLENILAEFFGKPLSSTACGEGDAIYEVEFSENNLDGKQLAAQCAVALNCFRKGVSPDSKK